MADGVRIDFPNGRELAAALRQLPEDVRGEVLATALVEGAEPIKEDAQQRASQHRGPRRRPETPPLQDTIRTEVGRIDEDSAEVRVGTNKKTAHLREFGHAKAGGGTVPAYPFLRPAADEHAEEAVKVIGETLGREIEKAFAARAPHEAE